MRACNWIQGCAQLTGVTQWMCMCMLMCRFSTYASWWIRERILSYIAKNSRLIRLPTHVQSAIRTMRVTSENMSEDLGRKPTAHELANAMNMTPEKFRLYGTFSPPQAYARAVASAKEGHGHAGVTDALFAVGDSCVCVWDVCAESSSSLILSLDADKSRSLGSSVRLADNIAATDGPSPEDSANEMLVKDMLERMMQASLTPREIQVLEQRYGLRGDAPKTVAQVGMDIEESKGTVRSIEARAFQKLRLSVSSAMPPPMSAQPTPHSPF